MRSILMIERLCGNTRECWRCFKYYGFRLAQDLPIAWDVIASKVPSGNSGGKGWEFRYASDASLRFRLGGASGSNTEVDTAVGQFTSGAWHHFVASYNKDTRIGKAYLNGNMLKAENMGTRSPWEVKGDR